jgi:hypothetical protein
MGRPASVDLVLFEAAAVAGIVAAGIVGAGILGAKAVP